MSTQTAQATTPVTETQPVATATVVAQPQGKKSKITDSIVSTLKGLGEGETMTIADLSAKMTSVKRETLQATLSQMVKAKRVEKVVTGKRQPGYRAVK